VGRGAQRRPPLRTVGELRVRYGDTDAMGVVYYANYLRYFEAARVEYLRRLGQDYRAIEASGIIMVVTQTACRYHLSARFDDLLTLGCRVTGMRRSSFRFEYDLRRAADDARIATGWTEHACLARETLRPVRLPAELARAIDAFEQGG